MSETSLVQLEKKRSELENELSSTVQKEATLVKELEILEEEVSAQLTERIQEKRVVVEDLGSKKSDLERRLKELKEDPKTFQMLEKSLESGAESVEQKAEPTQTTDVGQPQQVNMMEENHSEDAVSVNIKRCCSYCGALNKTDAVFCERCGNKVG